MKRLPFLAILLASCSGSDVRSIDDAALVSEPTGEKVRGGSRVPNGMPAYRNITDDQLLAIRHYIRHRAEAGLVSSPK